MAVVGLERQFYVRVYREVEATPELEKFRARIINIGESLGDVDSTTRQEPASLEEELREGFTPRIRGIGIAALKAYEIGTYRSTLLEIRRPRSQRSYSYLSRLSKRLDPILGRIEASSPPDLMATASYLVESTRPEHGKRVREFGVVINYGPTQKRLVHENNLLYQGAATTAGKELHPVESSQVADPTIIPILSVPADTNAQLLWDFVNQANEEAFDPKVHFTFELPDKILKGR